MADIFTRKLRSQIMSRIRSKNTSPELKVRRFFHKHGFRFRLHARNLPGAPDLVFPKYQAVIFIHGCFWHQHPGCRRATVPSSNREYWEEKFRRTLERDRYCLDSLRQQGWKPFVIWECEINEKHLFEIINMLVSDNLH